MENNLIIEITKDLEDILTIKQSENLKITLVKYFSRYDIFLKDTEKRQEDIENSKLINKFLSAKEVEGCSIKTIEYYRNIITKMTISIEKSIKNMTTEDLRQYLSKYKEENASSLTTIDNMRRIFSSFFAWLEDENYIVKSPARRIHKIKTAKVVKNTFSDENIEQMRDLCKNDIRNLVLIELFLTTGMRVGELVNLNISDINFEERSCVVLGKGNKQREVYFDAKTKIHLQEYLKIRNDNENALFVSKNKPYQRLSISGIELIIRNIGKSINIDKAYPHKFRRTLATMAIDKGMPIEQVQKLLGHVKIETTMHYAMVNQNNVKISHRKYIG
jgi:site-specific recombinase XerD